MCIVAPYLRFLAASFQSFSAITPSFTHTVDQPHARH
jgi:hypothetical protein